MEDILPSDFHLSQNYPNPFSAGGGSAYGGNPGTVIKYCVPYKTNINLEVFNSDGKSVKVLTDEIKPAGTYQVEFLAKGIAGGDYFYRLEAVHFIEIKKMVLIK